MENFNSKKYWENRYSKKGNSGLGSYGLESEFKSSFLNKFIEDNNIKNITDLGCGDGNQISQLYSFEKYYGYDVSKTVINICNDKFNGVDKLSFHNDYNSLPISDLTMSLDVTYHIIEDSYFNEYMKMLFDKSSKYVILYTINSSDSTGFAQHLKNREIKTWIEKNIYDFQFKSYSKYSGKSNGIGFFIYEKK